MNQKRRAASPKECALTTPEKISLALSALEGRKAVDPVLLDMRDLTIITDYFLICHGTSSTHLRGLVDAVTTELTKKGARPASVEGSDESGWTLIDYGDLIVHIFAEEERSFYSLERLWSDAPRVAAAAEA